MLEPWIVTDAAALALRSAQASGIQDPLRLGRELERALGLSPEQRAAILTQLDLHRRASARWGEGMDGLLFTRDGLEQATRPPLARWRAERLRALGVRAVADLGCGLGFEARAMADTGLRVTAVEIDDATAALARANLQGRGVEVIVGDVTDATVLESAVRDVDAVFLDPARRDPAAPRSIEGLSGHRIATPEHWSPPWPWILQLAEQHPRMVVKVAPGIDHALIPSGGSAVWASVDGDLVEASLWFPGFADLAERTALTLEGGVAQHLDTGMVTRDDITPVLTHIIDCAPVVTRSGLVTTLAATIGATRIDEHIGYLTCDEAPVPSPFHTSYNVLEVMPFDRKRVGDAIAAAGCRALTVMKRGFAADTEQLRRQWIKRCEGKRDLVVALTRIGDSPTAIICER